MVIRIVMAALVGALGLVGTAQGWEGPKVDYSADTTMETAEGKISGTVNYTPGKERRDFVQEGRQMAMIFRHDRKVSLMLMPQERAYMEVAIPEGGRKDDLRGYKVEQRTIGPETVNGVKTTKSEIAVTSPQGEKMTGHWWTSKEGIVVRMDAAAAKGSRERFSMELRNLRIARQDPALFEAPADYQKIDMSFGGIGRMMQGGSGEAAPEREPVGDQGLGLKDALKLFK
jgi:hypothetical protein